ncbi:unnamed protein product [Sphagnum jensenii]|uniref:Uncharacterized protein n=1 Tax=Sphagnum jensenii TaxID=128206 RepID=A0ABP1C2I4_9BRYO
MGWFLPSHMDQGVIFGVLGVWHIYNTLHNFIMTPKEFRARTWFLAKGLPTLLRGTELWVLMFIVLVFVCKQLSHAGQDIASGIILTEHLQRFQHVTFATFFLIYVVIGLVTEHFPATLPLPEGAVQATFALGFLMELVVFHFGHHPGTDLESFIHMLMQLILVCLVTLLFLQIMWPRSVLIAVARCMMLIMKGTWFFQIGLLINVPYHIPLGCSIADNEEYPLCATKQADMRAKSLQVLIFGWQAAGIVIGTLVCYVFMLHHVSSTTIHSVLTPTPRFKELPQLYFVVPEASGDKESHSSSSDAVSDGGDVDTDSVPILSDAPLTMLKQLSSRNYVVSEEVLYSALPL